MNEVKNFDEFKSEVVGKVREYLPESFKDAAVELHTVQKNNLELTGLTIRSIESNVCPTIYLEHYYDRFVDGADMSEVLAEIARVRMDNEFGSSFDTDSITNWERCKDRVIPRLVGKDGNEKFLAERPYTEIVDLAVVYAVLLEQSVEDGSMSVPVNASLIETWGVSLEELHEVALANLSVLTPSSFRGMTEVMCEISGMDEEDLVSMGLLPEDEKLFVLSNSMNLNGATALLDKEVLAEIVEKLGENFRIIPSSVHEVLICGDTSMSVEDLASMTAEVNDSQVAPEDRLSYNIYKYSLKDGLQLA